MRPRMLQSSRHKKTAASGAAEERRPRNSRVQEDRRGVVYPCPLRMEAAMMLLNAQKVGDMVQHIRK